MAGASGDADEARRLLRHDLPLALLEPSQDGGAARAYTGPLQRAVFWFIKQHVPYFEQQLARQNEEDFLMYIFQDVLVGVEKPLLLIELCLSDPGATLDELVNSFAWRAKLKRSPAQKREWVVDQLRSMLKLGVPLPREIIATVGDEGEAKYEYNERAFATSLDRMQKSWKGFKHAQGLDVAFAGINTSDTSEGVEAEAIDVGVRLKARLVLSEEPEILIGSNHDIIIIGKELGPEITNLLDDMHTAAPLDGYYPIAWHKVFWKLCDKYLEVPLELRRDKPYLMEDGTLKDYIVTHYTEVRGKSLSFVRNRREGLEKRCNQVVMTRLSQCLDIE